MSESKEEFLRTAITRYEQGNWSVDEDKIDDLTECLKSMPPFDKIPTLDLSLKEIQKGIVLLFIRDKNFVPHKSLSILRGFNSVLKKRSRESTEFNVRKYPNMDDFSLEIAINLPLPSRICKSGKFVYHIREDYQVQTTFWNVYEYIKQFWQDTVVGTIETWMPER